MSAEKDSMLRVRLTQRQSDELDAIIDELQAQMPEASVTTSSIARYALEKYVSDYIAKRDGTKILIEINTADATEEDIKNLYDLLSKLFYVIRRDTIKPIRNTGGAIMSTEKDSMLRVRLTQRQSDELDAIIGELQAQMPEASVTTSSIARYALEKYVSDHIAKRDGTKIFIEINTADATDEDIKNLYDLLSKLFDETKENYSPTVHYMVGEILEPVMMKMARLIKLKKPEVRDGE